MLHIILGEVNGNVMRDVSFRADTFWLNQLRERDFNNTELREKKKTKQNKTNQNCETSEIQRTFCEIYGFWRTIRPGLLCTWHTDTYYFIQWLYWNKLEDAVIRVKTLPFVFRPYTFNAGGKFVHAYTKAVYLWLGKRNKFWPNNAGIEILEKMYEIISKKIITTLKYWIKNGLSNYSNYVCLESQISRSFLLSGNSLPWRILCCLRLYTIKVSHDFNIFGNWFGQNKSNWFLTLFYVIFRLFWFCD